MFITLFVVFLLLTIVLFAFAYHSKSEGLYVSAIFSILITIGLFITCIVFACNIGTSKTIDAKIQMYEEENAQIEEKIDTLVTNYMNYEKDTYSEFKTENSITLVSMIPELKSDELVQQQLNTYVYNYNKIIHLKEERINKDNYKWLLYFG